MPSQVLNERLGLAGTGAAFGSIVEKTERSIGKERVIAGGKLEGGAKNMLGGVEKEKR